MSRSAERRRLAAKQRAAQRRAVIGVGLGLAVVLIGVLVWSYARSRPATITSPEQVQRIGVAEARALAEEGRATILDVRSRESYDAEHAKGAVAFPEGEWQQNLASLPEDGALIFYCT